MKRMTVHVSNAKRKRERIKTGPKKGLMKLKTYNTLSFEVKNEQEQADIRSDLEKKGMVIEKETISNIK